MQYVIRYTFLFSIVVLAILNVCGQSPASDSLFYQACDLYESGKYVEAIPIFERVALIDQEEVPLDADLESMTRQWIASCYYKTGNVDKAQQESPLFYDQEPVNRALTKEARKLTPRIISATNIDMAIFWTKQVLEEEEKALGKNHYYVLGSYCNLVQLYHQKGDSAMCRQYINLGREVGNHLKTLEQGWKAYFLAIESSLEFLSGNKKRAKEIAMEAYNLAKGHLSIMAYAYNTILEVLLNVYMQESDIDKANALASEVEQEYMSLSVSQAKLSECGSIVIRLCGYYAMTGQPSKGMPILERAIGNEAVDTGLKVVLLYSRGTLHKIAMDIDKAVADILESINMNKKLFPGDNSSLGPHYFTLGEAYDMARDFKRSESSFKTALQMFKRQGEYAFPGYLQTLHHLGAIATRTNEYDKAIGYLDECLKFMDLHDIGSINDRAFIMKERGNCESGRNHYDIALQYYRKAMEIYETNGLPLTEETYFDASQRACLLILMKNPQDSEAKDILKKLKSIFTEDNLYHQRMRIRLKKFESDYLNAVGQYDMALGLIDEAIEEVNSIEYGDESSLWYSKFAILLNLERKDEAMEVIENYKNETEDRFGRTSHQYVEALMLQSLIFTRLGELTEFNRLNGLSDELISLASEVYTKGDPQLETITAIAARNKAFIHPNEAAKILRGCLSRSIIQNPGTIVMIYATLADIERMMGNKKKAVEYADKVFDYGDMVFQVDLNTAMDLYGSAGNAYLNAGYLARAEEVFNKAYSLAENAGMSEKIGALMITQYLSDLYNVMGKQDKAIDYRNRANRIISKNYSGFSVLMISNLLNGLWIKYDSGRKEECLKDIDEIEVGVRKLTSASNIDASLPLRLRGMYYHKEGRLDEAEEWGLKALNKNRTVDNLSLCGQIAFDKEDFSKAESLSKECLKTIESYFGKDAYEAVSINKMLGDTYLRVNRLEEATRHYRRAFNNASRYVYDNLLTFTADQRADFWASNFDFFRNYLPMLCYNFSTDDDMAGLLYDSMLFSNGLLLNVDKSIIRAIQKSDDYTQELYAELNSKKEAIGKLAQQGESNTDLENDVYNIEQDLMSRLRNNDSGSDRWSAPTWKRVRKSLPKGAAAVEFIDFSLNSDTCAGMAVIITRDMKNPVVRKLYIRDKNDNLQADNLYEDTTLGDLLWRQIGEEVMGCRDIYFVPQGPLLSIALESLPISENTIPQGSALHRLSSTAELIYANKQRQEQTGATLYGGLNYDTTVEELKADAERYPELLKRGFVIDNLLGNHLNRKSNRTIPYLEGSRTEVDSIRLFLARSQNITPVFHTWNDGTETSVKALSGQYGNVLHISTHGFYMDTSSDVDNSGLTIEDKALQNSGLLMSGAANRYFRDITIPDNIDDGILTAAEIAELDFSSVDMTVLSACETGLGRITGDGVFGLQRGFKKAGAGSILMSLWKVDDEATCHLMTEFYRHWLGDPMAGIAPVSKYAALEAAKISVRSNPKWTSPFFWAAFILLDALD